MKQSSISIIIIILICILSKVTAQTVGPDGAILVPNRTKSSLSIIFTDPSKPPVMLELLEGPSELVISPDRKFAVISHYGYVVSGNSLTVINLENFTVSRNLAFGQHVRPNGISFIPGTKKLLATNEVRNSVWVIDFETDKIIAEILTNQSKPRLIAVHPSGKAAYVTNETSGTLTIIDLEKFTVAGNVQIGRGIEGVAVSPGGKEVWIANKLDHTVTVVETSEHKIVDTFSSPVSPTRFLFTPDGKNVIILNTRSGHLTIVNARTKLDEKYISPDTFSDIFETKQKVVIGNRSVFATSQTSGNLEERAAEISTGKLPVPVGITISPNGDYAFISSRITNTVTAMYLSGDQKFELAGSFPIENAPSAVAFLPSEVKVADYITESRFDRYWDSNRPSAMYFTDLEKAADDEFTKEHEIQFLFVLEEEELKQYESLPDIATKKDYIKGYINNKDENPLNPVNYWFLEYLGRVAYAKEHYSRTKPPLIDDRGKFYIKYGPPFRKEVDPGGIKRHEYLTSLKNDPGSPFYSGDRNSGRIAALPQPEYVTFPNETWTWHLKKGRSLTVHFAENPYFKELKNGLEDVIDGAKPLDKTWYWMDLVKERHYMSAELDRAISEIERFQDLFWIPHVGRKFIDRTVAINPNNPVDYMQSYSWEVNRQEKREMFVADVENIDTRYVDTNLIEFHLETAQFKGTGGDTKVNLTAYSDPKQIRLFDEQSEQKKLNLEMHYLLRDSAFTEISRNKAGATFGDITGMDAVLVNAESSLQPVDGDLTVQLNNSDTGETGFGKFPVTIRDFTGEDLMLSDIMYFTSAQGNEIEKSYMVENIKGSKVIKYPLPYINRRLPLLCYFEAYNLLRIKAGSIYKVEMKLTRDESGYSPIRKLGGIFRGGGEEIRSITYQLTDYENDWKELIGFDLSDVDKGKYDLEITITSLVDESITAVSRKKLEIR